MTGVFIIGFLLINLLIAYHKPNRYVWSLGMMLYFLVTYKLVNSIHHSYYIIGYVVLFLVVAINIPFIRNIFSSWLYYKARGVLPAISETEKLALDAGDSWWEKDIFQGKPNFKKLHSLNKFSISKEERDFIENETNQLCSMIDDWQITRIDRDLPVEIWKFLRDHGFFGLVIKKDYGGKGFSAAAHSQIVLKVSTRSTSAAVTVMVPNSLGPGELLQHYGTDEQKNHYLPRLAAGIDIPCFALTGPTAGSDATSIPDLGTVVMGEYNGTTMLGIKLTGINKRYITLAPIATLVGLAFKLQDPNRLLGNIGREGITCALLPYNHNGVEIGNRLIPLDQAFMNGTVRIKETFIPIDWIIGGQKMAGEGWMMLVECLSIGRSISLPTCGTANAILSAITTSAYSVIREQFKVSIGQFEGIEEGLAQIAGLTYMCNSTRRFTVAAVDQGVRPSVASAIAKYHITEYSRTAVNWAMDIHAGRGIIVGPNNYLAQMYQAVPVAITVEGANIMTRNLMIFGQGAMRCHPYIRDIYESLMVTTGFVKFDTALFGSIGYTIQNKVRGVFHAITAGKFASGYKSQFNQYYKAISRLSSAGAYIVDLTLMFFGSSLKIRERLSARLGDFMSHLYIASAVLKYFSDNGEKSDDVIYVKWCLEHSLYQAQTALINTLNNFPKKYLATAVLFILFPYGLPHKKPSDMLDKKLAQSLMRNTDTRQALISEIYLPLNIKDPIGRMEFAFQSALSVMPIKDKITQAIKSRAITKTPCLKTNAISASNAGVITLEELEKIKLSLKYSNDVIQVDEFGPFDLGPKNAHKI